MQLYFFFCFAFAFYCHDFLIFQLHFSFSIILYWFQVYSLVIRLYVVFSLMFPVSMVAYIIIKMLLTVFPMLCSTSFGYFVPTNLYFLIASPFLPSPPKPFPFGTYQLALYVWESVSFLKTCFRDRMRGRERERGRDRERWR